MEKYIYIGIIVILLGISIYFWFNGKKEKVKEVIRRTMVLARIWLHSEDGHKKEAWVIKEIIDSVGTISNAPITKKLLLMYLTEDRIKKIIDKLVPEVKLEVKPLLTETLNSVSKVAINEVTNKVINAGIGNSANLSAVKIQTSHIIDLANNLKMTDKDTGLLAATAMYRTDFDKEKEFLGTIGFVKKF